MKSFYCGLIFNRIICHRNAQVEVKNKKGNSPMWLAANGGHLQVIELLYNVGADIDSQDNRKVIFYFHSVIQNTVKFIIIGIGVYFELTELNFFLRFHV